MSNTFAVNDANAVKLWSRGVQVAVREKAEVGRLMGKDDTAIIQVKTDLTKGKGDNIKFNLRGVLNGDGFTEGQRATGNGEQMSFYQDQVTVNELGHVANPTSEFTIDAQRVPFEPRDEGRGALSEWWANRISVTALNHFCGFVPANSAPFGTKYTGNNTVTVPSSSKRQVWATSSVTTDQGLGSSDKANLNMIDRAQTQARLGDNMVRPAKIGGSDKWVIYLHPQQAEDIMTNTSTGQWFSIQQAAMTGGMITKNGIYTGALGEYKNAVMRVTQHVTQGVNSGTGVAVATTRRAVMLGAQAGALAYCKRGNPGNANFRWTERYEDHDRFFEMGAWSIWGLKKPVFALQEDQGVVVMSSFSAI